MMHEKHGLTKHPIYTSWRAMRRRCLARTDEHWPDYGGRGIGICREWSSFPKFYAWAMQAGWAAGLTIDRIDVEGHYCPENCRWTDMLGQAENKRPSKVPRHAVLVTHEGSTLTMSEWARRSGIGYTTLMKRHGSGLTGASLFAPITAHKSHRVSRP